ncbi:MAG TPA: ABC transporter ATP-binding protein [Thermoanaerobaculia bacterium]|nr:ABC transporter ATP-binding protein [Thermoanaerobaculia bacterium]
MLTISGLSKTYSNGVRALDGVELRVERGLFGLLGPNGAGKSSLMRTIATLQEPDRGTITLDGLDILAQPAELRRRLGYLPQDFGVYPGVSALALLDHIAVLKGIGPRGARRDEVEGLLRLTNLHDVRHKAVSTFSGGMRQRFGIAQALLGNPSLIIVDEPTAGLDPEERNRFHNLLSEIGENAVVILSTHIVEDVSDLCPRMAILARGRVVREGVPAQLINEMRGKLWKRTVAKSEVDSYRARYDVIATRLFAGQTQLHVIANGRPEAGFEEAMPDLEDVYFSVLSSLVREESVAC